MSNLPENKPEQRGEIETGQPHDAIFVIFVLTETNN